MTDILQSALSREATFDVARLGYVDALQCSRWDRELLQQWRDGNLACVQVTLAIWEGARDTLREIAAWHRRFRDHADLIAPARSVEEIVAVAASGRTGVVFGFQNASPFEDDLGMVQVFHELGVRVVQLTYNISNHVGSSCYEPVDGGLTRFGRNVVREMNRLGMIVDVSHVGKQTIRDTLEWSQRPIIASHANPASVWEHPRNMDDDILQRIADGGGMLACAPYPHLTGGDEVSGKQWAEGVAYAVDLMGVDHVGIGTDSSHHYSDEDLLHIRMGHWTHEINYGAGSPDRPGWLPWPEFFRTPADFPKLDAALGDVGFSASERSKILGGNLVKLYADGFGPAG